MNFGNEFRALMQHAHLLRASMNLAHDRHLQLEQTMRNLGFSSMPTNREDFTRVQVLAAKEIGGIQTKMLLDGPLEIEKYHFGPLQIALSLLFAVIEKYKKISNTHPVFRDDAFDKYCDENYQFVELLKSTRNSILHQRYDNLDEQAKFTEKFTGDGNKHMVTLLIEGDGIYEGYLRRLWCRLQEGDRDET